MRHSLYWNSAESAGQGFGIFCVIAHSRRMRDGSVIALRLSVSVCLSPACFSFNGYIYYRSSNLGEGCRGTFSLANNCPILAYRFSR